MEANCLKVVYRNSYGVLVSCIHHGTDLEVVYTPGQEVKARAGRIFVFGSIKSAKSFRGCHPDQEIWSAYATGLRRQPWMMPWQGLSLAAAIKFWTPRLKEFLTLMNTPRGTKTAKTIILLERVA